MLQRILRRSRIKLFEVCAKQTSGQLFLLRYFKGFLILYGTWGRIGKSSQSQMFFKIGVLVTFEIFSEKHLCFSLFSIKLQAFRLYS